MKNEGTYTIGRLARAAGVHIETIRFYERRGLLPPPPRGANGYRRYGPEALPRLLFIRRAQALGFSLAEIGALLRLRVRGGVECEAVRRRVEAKRAAVAAKIRALRALDRALARLLDACRRRAATAPCPIVEAWWKAPEAPEAPRPGRAGRGAGRAARNA